MNFPCGKLWKRTDKKRKNFKRDIDPEDEELELGPRIVNGTLTKQGDSPWQVRGTLLAGYRRRLVRLGMGKFRERHAS